MESFPAKEFLISIFFDIEKAYDTVWKHNIVKELLNHGLKGNLIYFIQNFLTERNFKISIGNITSCEKIIQNGIPQGSKLSCTLFTLVINSIFESISTPIKSVMYADDLCYFKKLENR